MNTDICVEAEIQAGRLGGYIEVTADRSGLSRSTDGVHPGQCETSSLGPTVGTITERKEQRSVRTYVGPGMKGAGPTSKKPMMMRRQPVAVAILGVTFLSHSQPQQGAVRAYVPPLMTNMRPSTIGGRSNWRRWGSSVACRNPMLVDVTMMLDAASSTPGILSTCSRLAAGEKRRLGLV